MEKLQHKSLVTDPLKLEYSNHFNDIVETVVRVETNPIIRLLPLARLQREDQSKPGHTGPFILPRIPR